MGKKEFAVLLRITAWILSLTNVMKILVILAFGVQRLATSISNFFAPISEAIAKGQSAFSWFQNLFN